MTVVRIVLIKLNIYKRQDILYKHSQLPRTKSYKHQIYFFIFECTVYI